jgi:hypothetical protein
MPAIRQAADWFAASILAGRMVHCFGSGHSRILVEEMWPRYGSFPGFNPIVELSLTFHNGVVGANGQRQAMFLENVSGLADRILRNFELSKVDSAFVVSSSGCNRVPIEMAEGFKRVGMKVVVLISKRHSEASESRDARGLARGVFRNAWCAGQLQRGFSCLRVVQRPGDLAGSSPEADSIISAYRVRTFPTLLFLDQRGVELSRIEGYPGRLAVMQEAMRHAQFDPPYQMRGPD